MLPLNLTDHLRIVAASHHYQQGGGKEVIYSSSDKDYDFGESWTSAACENNVEMHLTHWIKDLFPPY